MFISYRMRERDLKPGEMEVVISAASSPNKQFVLEKEVNVRQTVITFKEHCDKNYFKNVNEVKFVKKTPPCANNEDITLDSTFTNGISDCHWPKAGMIFVKEKQNYILAPQFLVFFKFSFQT